MPFDPDKFLAEGEGPSSESFDPEAFLAGGSEQPAQPELSSPDNTVGAGEALVRGAGQGLSLGFADEIYGGLASAGESALQAAQELDLNKLGLSNVLKNYEENRDEYRARDQKASDEQGLAYGAGELAGGVGTMAVPVLGPLGKGVKGAAALGGLYGLGKSEEESAGGLVRDAGYGALIGGGLAGAGAALGKASEKLRPWLAQKARAGADNMAVGALHPRMKNLKREFGSDKMQKLGRMLLDKKIIRPFDSAEDLAYKLRDASNAVGEQIGSVIDDIPNEVILQNRDLKKQFLERYMQKHMGVNPDARALGGKVGQYLEDLKYASTPLQTPPQLPARNPLAPPPRPVQQFGMTPRQAHEAQRALGRKIKYQNPMQALPEVDREFHHIRQRMQDAIQAADKSGRIAPLRQDYHLLELGEQMATNQAVREGANQTFSLGDRVISGAGGAAFGPTGLLGGPAASFLRTRGGSTAAVTLDNLSKHLSKNPQLLGKYAAPLAEAARRGTNALAVSNYVLSKRSPEYRALLEQINSDENAGR